MVVEACAAFERRRARKLQSSVGGTGVREKIETKQGVHHARPENASPLAPVLRGEGPGVRGMVANPPTLRSRATLSSGLRVALALVAHWVRETPPHPQPFSPGVPGEKGARFVCLTGDRRWRGGNLEKDFGRSCQNHGRMMKRNAALCPAGASKFGVNVERRRLSTFARGAKKPRVRAAARQLGVSTFVGGILKGTLSAAPTFVAPCDASPREATSYLPVMNHERRVARAFKICRFARFGRELGPPWPHAQQVRMLFDCRVAACLAHPI